MHQFDPNGSLHEYRLEMERRELRTTIVYAVVTVVMSMLILAAVDITLSLFDK
jgi:hypothetical protein